ncbi:MAG: glycerol-3-phosphate dehydrogenase [Candidatus Cloacimonetes bacterium 4572_65]|nr:MAG: glycerol-3-phosphate dehydrogenase [Candidatus Cloacimonetes bacterium 4572_65]
MNIAIIGGGSWGLAISKLLHDNGHTVCVWEYNKDFVKVIKETKRNDSFLPQITIEAFVSNNIDEVITNDTDIVVLATPSAFLKKTLLLINEPLANNDKISAIINLAKGFNHETGDILSDMITDYLPKKFADKICALSGPSHAEEVAKQQPTTVTVAGKCDETLKIVQVTFSNKYFRVYRTSDIIGVELGGAIKNVIALAAGVVKGLGYGDNTLGALLTRGNVEIKRLALVLGAKAETLDGLAGIGDLITTAISPHSRNRFVGYEIGSGKSLKEVLENMVMVAEGVPATYTVHKLAQKYNVEMPIVDGLYQVLEYNASPKDLIMSLMSRNLTSEER